MLNKVILIGRLTTDIEMRYSADQTPYCYFTLAVNRSRAKDKTDFISCVAFRATAELMSRYLSKGSLISAEGSIEVYNSQKNGEFITRTNVVVNNIVFLDTRKSNSSSDSKNANTSFSNNNQSFEDNNIETPSPKKDSVDNEEFDFDNFEIKI